MHPFNTHFGYHPCSLLCHAMVRLMYSPSNGMLLTPSSSISWSFLNYASSFCLYAMLSTRGSDEYIGIEVYCSSFENKSLFLYDEKNIVHRKFCNRALPPFWKKNIVFWRCPESFKIYQLNFLLGWRADFVKILDFLFPIMAKILLLQYE